MNNKTFRILTLVLSILAVVLFIIGHWVDWSLWGTKTAQSLTSIGIAFAVSVVILFLLMFLSKRSISTDSGGPLSPAYGIIAAIVYAVIAIAFTGEGFFWRNLFADHIGIFGSFSSIADAYKSTPPGSGVTAFWENSSTGTVLAVILSAVYALLLFLTARELSRDGKNGRTIFVFLATAGLAAIFVLHGDFSLYLVLASAGILAGLMFLRDTSRFWIIGLILIAGIIFHPSFVLLGLALIIARFIPGTEINCGIGIAVLLVLMILGAVLSFFGFAPFESILRPDSTAITGIDGDHIWGFLNQLFMVGHFIWILALISVVVRFLTGNLTRRDVFIGGWFLASIVFYIPSYSDYGWILGYPASAIVILPAVIWIAHYAASMSIECDETPSLIPIAVANTFAVVLLLFSVSSPGKSAETYSIYIADEAAFSPRKDNGIMSLMMSAMLSDEIKKYDEALLFLDPYIERLPSEPLGLYYHAWATIESGGDLNKSMEKFRTAERILEREGRMFWEFNYRIGRSYFKGGNPTYGSTRLERAIADSATNEILNLLAFNYDRMKINDSIISKYEQLMERGETTAIALFRMGYAAVREADTALGLEYFNRSIHQFPQYMDCYEFPARVLFLEGKYDSLKALAEWGLQYNQRSPELEACMILVYHYLGEPEKRDSAYQAYIDYFVIYPGKLIDWGNFLEANGLIYEGRKMAAADVNNINEYTGALLQYYWFLKEVDDTARAKLYVDSVYNAMDDDDESRVILDKLRAHDDDLWPDM